MGSAEVVVTLKVIVFPTVKFSILVGCEVMIGRSDVGSTKAPIKPLVIADPVPFAGSGASPYLKVASARPESPSTCQSWKE